MLTIRLTRVGRAHDPSYRLIVIESFRSAKSRRSLEILGSYNPRKPKKESAVVDADRARHWLNHGAQVSDTAHNILVSAGVIPGPKRDVRSREKAASAAPDGTAATRGAASVPRAAPPAPSTILDASAEETVSADAPKTNAPEDARAGSASEESAARTETPVSSQGGVGVPTAP